MMTDHRTGIRDTVRKILIMCAVMIAPKLLRALVNIGIITTGEAKIYQAAANKMRCRASPASS